MIWIVYLVTAAFLFGLKVLADKRYNCKLSYRILTALVIGVIFGIVLNVVFSSNSINQEAVNTYKGWLSLIGYGYVDLLKMIIVPLIMVSLLAALFEISEKSNAKKMIITIITILVLTAGIAALIAYFLTQIFQLNAASIQMTEQIASRAESLSQRSVSSLSGLLRSFIPSNIFSDMAQQRSSSIIAVLIFSLILGGATLQVRARDSQIVQPFINFIHALRRIIMQLTRLVMSLTPYGIFALITRVAISTNGSTLLEMLKFVGVSYITLLVVLFIHLLILAAAGYSPLTYLKKAWPVLSFAFVSRSSAATIPLNIEYQQKQLGVDNELAAMSASLGSSIGQNGCAGVYPTMLVVMIWNALGTSVGFFDVVTLLLVVMISSFGVAGVGGGATSASLIVLATMGLGEHVALAAVLISVEPIIDMMRTLVNVSDSMVAGLVSGRILKMNNQATYDAIDTSKAEESVDYLSEKQPNA